MPQNSQELLDSVLKEALVLAEPARQCYLDSTCGRDTDLRRHVEELLLLAEEDNSMLQPGGATSGPLWRELREKHRAQYALATDDLVGVYRIVRRLGIGGMASVYLAERADGQLEQKVALKILDREDTEDALLRFNQERQILASLDHPNIARSIDAGLAADARPYVTMEFIDGEPIDIYCDRYRLTIRERLVLFKQVVDAVQAAHRNLIIHRDIKASNVLVTADGVPKLLDFGIAKLLDPTLPHAAPATRSAVYPMTPDYASPEQIRGEPLSTATDIYQLGYLLFLLLTGCRPYRYDQRNYLEMLDAICEKEPEKPSQMVFDGSSAVRSAQERADDRRTSTRALSKRLRGDLDNICLVALRKEPQRRYDSAGKLAEDLQRHLSDLPVSAYRNSAAYRLKKFATRHTAGFVLSIGIVAVSVAGATYYTYRIDQERQIAEVSAAQAEEIAAFMTNLFKGSDPMTSAETLTVRQLLDIGAARVEGELDVQPQVQASLMRTMAEAYLNLGFYEDAEKLANRSVEVYEAELGEDHEETLRSLNLLSQSYFLQARYRDSEMLSRRVYEQRKIKFGPEAVPTVNALNNLSTIIYMQGRMDDAELHLLDVLALRRKQGENSQLVAALHNLGNVYMSQGLFASAAEYHGEAATLSGRLHGEDHYRTLNALGSLGIEYRGLGELAAAEQAFLEIEETLVPRLGEDHPQVLFAKEKRIGVLTDQERYDEARELMRSATDLSESKLGAEHPRTLWLRFRLADIAIATRDYVQAETILRDILSVGERVLGESQHETLSWAIVLGEVLEAQDKLEEAEYYYRQGLTGYIGANKGEFASAVEARVSLGSLLLRSGRKAEAEDLIATALTLVTKRFSRNPEARARVFAAHAENLARDGQLDEARAYLIDAHSAYETRYGPNHPDTIAAGQKLEALSTIPD